MKANTVKVKDVTLSYLDEGKGQPLVLLHGLCFASSIWEKIIPELAKEYRVIAPDLRGHGQSAVPAPPYSTEQMADDIIGLLDALEIEKAAIFGHSLGGYITLAIAEKYPQRLTALSLVHSLSEPDPEEKKQVRQNNIGIIQEKGMPTFIEGLIPVLFAPENLDKLPEEVNFARELGLHTAAGGAIGSLYAIKNRPDRTPVLKNLKLPILLIAGENDLIVPMEKTFSVEGDHVTSVVIKNAGHTSMLEAPEELLKAIKNFLNTKGLSS